MDFIFGIKAYKKTTKEDIGQLWWRINYHDEVFLFPHDIDTVCSYLMESDLRRSDPITKIKMKNGNIFYSPDEPEAVNEDIRRKLENDTFGGSEVDVYKNYHTEFMGMNGIYVNFENPCEISLGRISSIEEVKLGGPDRSSAPFVMITDITVGKKGWFGIVTYSQFYFKGDMPEFIKIIEELAGKNSNPRPDQFTPGG
jgi:hypothetical protein